MLVLTWRVGFVRWLIIDRLSCTIYFYNQKFIPSGCRGMAFPWICPWWLDLFLLFWLLVSFSMVFLLLLAPWQFAFFHSFTLLGLFAAIILCCILDYILGYNECFSSLISTCSHNSRFVERCQLLTQWVLMCLLYVYFYPSSLLIGAYPATPWLGFKLDVLERWLQNSPFAYRISEEKRYVACLNIHVNFHNLVIYFVIVLSF